MHILRSLITALIIQALLTSPSLGTGRPTPDDPQETRGPAPTPPEAALVILAPKWKVGDTLTIDFSRQTGAINPLTRKRLPEISQRIRLTVLETGPEGHVVEWHGGDFLLDGQPAPEQEIARSDPALALLVDNPIEVELTAEYELAGVRNLQEQLARLESAASARPPLIEPTPTGDDDRDKAAMSLFKAESDLRKFMDLVRENQNLMRNTFLAEPKVYFNSIGWSIPTGDGRESELVHPTPVEGMTTTSTIRTKLVDFDPSSATAILSMTQTWDPESLSAVVKATVEKVNTAAGIKRDVGEFRIEQSENAQYVIDRATGWCVVGEFTQQRTDSGKVKTKRWSWKPAPSDKP